MEVKGETHHVIYDPAASTVTFRGKLRVRGMQEYEPIVQLLSQVIAVSPKAIGLDLRELEFLNSQGINVLYWFVTQVHERGVSQMTLNLSEQRSWQKRMVATMQRLAPDIQVALGQ